MRHKVTRGIHQMNGNLAIFHANVNVQAKDQIGAGDHFQILDDVVIPFVRVDFLVAPV